MDGKITDGLFKSVYFWVSIAIVLCFFAATWYINRRVEKEVENRVKVVSSNVSANNIQMVASMLDAYDAKLAFIKAVTIPLSSKQAVEEAIGHTLREDSSIRKIYTEKDTAFASSSSTVRREFIRKGKQCFLRFSLPIDSARRLAMEVDLMGVHQKFSEIKGLNYAYVTISSQGVYIYHPDEKRIGTPVTGVDRDNERHILLRGKDSLINLNSDYLNIPVYRYYNPVIVGGEKWMFTANMPNLGFIESIRNTGNDFLVITLLAICAFIAVFSLGVVRWRKEFMRRREMEQQNLSLLLKDEQHKQAMVTAELERLKSGLNPHFLFNSLGSLRVLISKDVEVAKTFAITLSNLYRYMLKQENQQFVTLGEELTFTEDYISLQKIRFANRIVTEISLPETLMNHKVLPISIQLLVENCIKHTRISDSDPLRIRIFAENDLLVVVNNYNPREQETESSGKGIENLIKRYSFLTKTNCQFEVIDGCYIAKIPLL